MCDVNAECAKVLCMLRARVKFAQKSEQFVLFEKFIFIFFASPLHSNVQRAIFIFLFSLFHYSLLSLLVSVYVLSETVRYASYYNWPRLKLYTIILFRFASVYVYLVVFCARILFSLLLLILLLLCFFSRFISFFLISYVSVPFICCSCKHSNGVYYHSIG